MARCIRPGLRHRLPTRRQPGRNTQRRHSARCRRGCRGRRVRAPATCMGQFEAARARRAAAQNSRRHPRTRRRVGPVAAAGQRQTYQRNPRPGSQRSRYIPVFCSRVRNIRGPNYPSARRLHHHERARAVGRGGRHHAVEFTDCQRSAKARPGFGRRLRGGVQTR